MVNGVRVALTGQCHMRDLDRPIAQKKLLLVNSTGVTLIGHWQMSKIRFVFVNGIGVTLNAQWYTTSSDGSMDRCNSDGFTSRPLPLSPSRYRHKVPKEPSSICKTTTARMVVFRERLTI